MAALSLFSFFNHEISTSAVFKGLSTVQKKRKQFKTSSLKSIKRGKLENGINNFFRPNFTLVFVYLIELAKNKK